MMREILRSKIHRLNITATNIDYEGSITIDDELLGLAEILPGEKVQVVNVNNGQRFDTYVLSGKRGTGTVCLNGAAARLAVSGDIIIVIAYGIVDDHDAVAFKPKIVFVDSDNRPITHGDFG